MSVEPLDLREFEADFLDSPPAVQAHGVLLVVRQRDLVIEQASANTDRYLGLDLAEVIGAPLGAVIGPEPAAQLDAAVHVHGRAPGHGSIDPITFWGRSDCLLHLLWHLSGDAIVVEIERVEYAITSRPGSLFREVRPALDALTGATDITSLCRVVADAVKGLTGYDRVLVYRFHGELGPDLGGEVIAETRQDLLPAYPGRHYPASDLPTHAASPHVLGRVRVIADTEAEPIPVLPATASGTPLDLGLSVLRSASPFHLGYLRDMGVRATLTISLLCHQRLWGMIACHHGEPRRLDVQLRAACGLLGQMFSLQIAAQQDNDRLREQQRLGALRAGITAAMAAATSPVEGLTGSAPLDLTSADGLVVRIDGEVTVIGHVPPPPLTAMLLEALRDEDDTRPFVSEQLAAHLPEFAQMPGSPAGALGIALAPRFEDHLIWFRRGVSQLVRGPGEEIRLLGCTPPHVDGGRRSTPAALAERPRSHPWQEPQIAAAVELGHSVPELLLSRARDRLAYLAMHDPLTGLPNRSYLFDRLSASLEGGPEGVGLLFVDLDRFKMVNDRNGHAAGDDVLRETASRLTHLFRGASDTVARLSGDEFVVVCEGVNAYELDRLAARVVDAFRRPFAIGGEQVTVTTSVGAAMATPGITASELLRNADLAMYGAKRDGRNAVVGFTPAMRSAQERAVEIERRLPTAIASSALEVRYQPIYASSGSLEGFEALMRWRDEHLGVVAPSELLEVAAEAGLVEMLTDHVLTTAVSDLARWRRRTPDRDLTVSVNVSTLHHDLSTLPAVVSRALAGAALLPSALCVEITEAALVGDDTETRELLEQLARLNVRLSIDDFGTGCCALSYLSYVPVTEVKIDRSFVSRLPTSEADLAAVAATAALAHQLDLVVVAEGVESPEQLAAVRRLGCDRIQGYLLGRALTAGAVDTDLGRLLNVHLPG